MTNTKSMFFLPSVMKLTSLNAPIIFKQSKNLLFSYFIKRIAFTNEAGNTDYIQSIALEDGSGNCFILHMTSGKEIFVRLEKD